MTRQIKKDIEEVIVEEKEIIEKAPKPRPKFKRDIFRLESDKPKAINFEHVSAIERSGKLLIFTFYYGTSTFELADEEAAKSVFEQLVNLWAGEIQE